MVSRNVETVDAYLALLNEHERSELTKLRAMIRKALPRAVETIDYGMPVYKDDDGEMLVAFAAQKNNLAFYGPGAQIYAKYRDQLPKSAMGKSCLRFQSLGKLPDGLLRDTLQQAAKKA